MFGVSRSGYYSWVGRLEDKSGKRAQKEEQERDICEKMRQVIIAKGGIVPGKRTFRTELFRRFQIKVSTEHVAALMKKMNLVAQIPHKDAYKHQASHNHVCAAPPNGVAQDFFIGPRRVILTDITYLYYGYSRKVFYLCVFRDAYTRENLGWEVSTHMDVSLVRAAYDNMMAKHAPELKDSYPYIHSDQGSQYLSCTFKQLLEDDKFIQSVSARGNSQDNAPMESFFSRLKTDIIDLVALCTSFGSACALINGYLNAYNTEHYQYGLAGLTPHEFYQYATTGIYPLDSYFGVSAKDMMAIGDLKKVRRDYADDEARRRREASASKREARRMVDPLKIIRKDQALLSRKIKEWQRSESVAHTQIEHLEMIFEKTKAALQFLLSLTKEKLDKLKDPLVWRNYKELSYVFDMNELF